MTKNPSPKSGESESNEIDESPSPYNFGERLQALQRGNLNSPDDAGTGIEANTPPELQEEELQAELQQESFPRSDSTLPAQEQERTNISLQVPRTNTTTMSQRSATISEKASDLFGTVKRVGTDISFGLCEHPRADRSSDFKVLDRQRTAATTPPVQYGLPSYYSLGSLSMNEEKNDEQVGNRVTQMAFVGAAFKNKQMKLHLEKHDMLNGMLVPKVKDRN